LREQVNPAVAHPELLRRGSPDLLGIGVFSVADLGHPDARPFLTYPDPMPGVPDVGGNFN